ncbi:chromate transporter [Mycoplasma sp. Mirounga ES2805-ORL]|uniref:chromate transporter n=1 Tax=Mycoplasma sp. Mirounga ES2805-ORL TaxID=754514 RepID=UPI00197C6D40|nr:chromate transporter [Mycoplasma sp. Mirounga ES2805-ORL]QSF13980.1 chromate transporter [Mycoplasma sp. Mirounga ES2805-ORL]
MENKNNISFWKIWWFIIVITFIGFGGGNALIPTIKKYCVNKYKWLSEDEFEENVVLTNILPGPSVIESLTYIATKLLGNLKGSLAVLLGVLPHIVVVFLLFYFSKWIPTKYLYAIETGAFVAIIASLIGFVISFFNKAKLSNANYFLWLTLFFISFLFCLFIPAPFNLPAIILVIAIIIFFIFNKINKGKCKEDQ